MNYGQAIRYYAIGIQKTSHQHCMHTNTASIKHEAYTVAVHDFACIGFLMCVFFPLTMLVLLVEHISPMQTV